MSRLVLLALFLLAGCVSKFDNTEYMRVVDVTTLLAPTACADKKVLAETMTKFSAQMDWLTLYEGALPNNTMTSKMLTGVTQEATSFNVNGSEFYCKLKMEEMRHTLKLLLKAEARKPTS